MHGCYIVYVCVYVCVCFQLALLNLGSGAPDYIWEKMRSLTETLNCFSCSHMAPNFTKELSVEGKAKDKAKNLLYLIWVQLLVMLILRFYSASIFFFFLRFQDPDIFVLCKLSDVYLSFKWQARVTLGKPSLSQNLPQH